MNQIQIFQNQEFGAIRTMCNEQGEPMFCAKDVALALGYQNPERTIRKFVVTEDKVVTELVTTGGKKLTTFINESGLYSLILSSKLESAKRFKHWVTSEVLPSIRKQGGYMMARPEESDEVIMARALQIMYATLQRRDELIAKLQPRANYARQGLAKNRNYRYYTADGELITKTFLVWPEHVRDFIHLLVDPKYVN